MKIIKPTLFAVLSLTVLFFVYQKLKPKQNDYDYLNKLPHQIAELAEKKLAAEIKRYLAKDYSDKEGRNYQDISGLVKLHALQGGDASIYVISPEVQIDMSQQPMRAVLSFKAAMARGPKEPGALDIIPESASLYSFTLNLEKTDDGWLVKSASWIAD
ncbi:MAG: hypothetical protein ABL930_13635 [Pseudobdellovibrio sp.]